MALEVFKQKNDYGDANAEARACRTECALFDFSFLESVRLDGERASNLIESFTGRSLSSLSPGNIIYALRVGPTGEIINDLTVWRVGESTFEVMSGCRQDVTNLLGCGGPGINVTEMTPETATFAVQGPRALDALSQLGDVNPIKHLKYFSFESARLADIPCRVGRLGYTGEAGFEIIVEREYGKKLWQELSVRVRPAGFVAADSLRIEAGFVLFTNEFRLPVSPQEAGLGKFSRPANSFGPRIKLVSFRADADQLSWPWQPLDQPRRPVAPGTITVTSACESVAAGGILGLGYVPIEGAAETILLDPTGIFRNIRLTPLPFYDTAKRRPRAFWA
jgi:aminomethyltransferase